MNKQSLSACTSILVGKKAMADGSTVIGRNEDAKTSWPKHTIIHDSKVHTASNVFKSKISNFEINLPLYAAKYTATPEWTDKFGIFEEDGINEYGVCMSATESAYANSAVLGFDPFIDDGVSEESMVTIILPYIKTAREGILRLGNIVEEFGASEANGILFSDKDEVWYMEIGSGHHWVAQKIPDDSYAVVANQLSIQEIDFNDKSNFLYSSNIFEFVFSNHLNVSKNFNFREIFGTKSSTDLVYNIPRVWYAQKFLTPHVLQRVDSFDLPFIQKANRLLRIEDLKFVLSSHFQNTKFDPLSKSVENHKFRPISLAKTQESHLLQLRKNLPLEIAGIHWLSLGVSAQSNYIPIYFGSSDVHPAYKVGNQKYSPDSAYWIYKLVGVLVDPHFEKFSSLLSETQEKLDILIRQKMIEIDNTTLKLPKDKISKYLTKESINLQELGLKTYQQLAAELITNSTDLSPLNYNTDENL